MKDDSISWLAFSLVLAAALTPAWAIRAAGKVTITAPPSFAQYCKDEPVAAAATFTCEGGLYPNPAARIEWSGDIDPGSLLLDTSTGGSKSVTAICGGCTSDTVDFSVVEIVSVEGKANGKDVFFTAVDEDVDFTVTVDEMECPPSELEYDWDFGDGGMSFEENPSYKYSVPGKYTAIVTVRCSICPSEEKDDSVEVNVFKLEMITPAGDPVNTPVQSGDGQNEFTYSTANPGVLTMNLKAKVVPSGIANQIKDQCLFTVDAIAGSTLAWNAANPGGKPTASGDNLLATVTFTGLPLDNTGFGSKKAAILYDTRKQDEKPYEVFFPRDAANHPGGVATDPNWFYYWGKVYVNTNVAYVAAANLGAAPGIVDWKYTTAPNKTRIEIGNGHPAKFIPYGIGEEISGIDGYVGTIIHEAKHVAQIAAADPLLPTSGADSFRFGWSWNQGPPVNTSTHNHWTKGSDRQWGDAGVDDDGNGAVDDAAVAPPFEPGSGDDISLDHATWYWWPNTWPLPGGVYGTIHPIEGEAVQATDVAMNENDYARQDWGDPGKNHKTLNKWDD